MTECCKICDVCQKCTQYEQQKNYCTDHAKHTGLLKIQAKIKISDLAMTYMGSKAKDIVDRNFRTVSQYKMGKGDFGNIHTMKKFI